MTTAEILLEMLKYILPAALVLGAVALVMREQGRKHDTSERYALLKATRAQTLPLRLQAYERAILLLERISPENLIIRCDGNGKSSRQFQTQLLMEVRAEYEHNVSQQTYIRHESWMQLVSAKEKILSMINAAGKALPPDASGIDLGKTVLAQMMKSDKLPAHEAIRILKQDVQQMFKS